MTLTDSTKYRVEILRLRHLSVLRFERLSSFDYSVINIVHKLDRNGNEFGWRDGNRDIMGNWLKMWLNWLEWECIFNMLPWRCNRTINWCPVCIWFLFWFEFYDWSLYFVIEFLVLPQYSHHHIICAIHMSGFLQTRRLCWLLSGWILSGYLDHRLCDLSAT